MGLLDETWNCADVLALLEGGNHRFRQHCSKAGVYPRAGSRVGNQYGFLYHVYHSEPVQSYRASLSQSATQTLLQQAERRRNRPMFSPRKPYYLDIEDDEEEESYEVKEVPMLGVKEFYTQVMGRKWPVMDEQQEQEEEPDDNNVVTSGTPPKNTRGGSDASRREEIKERLRQTPSPSRLRWTKQQSEPILKRSNAVHPLLPYTTTKDTKHHRDYDHDDDDDSLDLNDLVATDQTPHHNKAGGESPDQQHSLTASALFEVTMHRKDRESTSIKVRNKRVKSLSPTRQMGMAPLRTKRKNNDNNKKKSQSLRHLRHESAIDDEASIDIADLAVRSASNIVASESDSHLDLTASALFEVTMQKDLWPSKARKKTRKSRSLSPTALVLQHDRGGETFQCVDEEGSIHLADLETANSFKVIATSSSSELGSSSLLGTSVLPSQGQYDDGNKSSSSSVRSTLMLQEQQNTIENGHILGSRQLTYDQGLHPGVRAGNNDWSHRKVSTNDQFVEPAWQAPRTTRRSDKVIASSRIARNALVRAKTPPQTQKQLTEDGPSRGKIGSTYKPLMKSSFKGHHRKQFRGQAKRSQEGRRREDQNQMMINNHDDDDGDASHVRNNPSGRPRSSAVPRLGFASGKRSAFDAVSTSKGRAR